MCELHNAAEWGYKRIQERYPFVPLSTFDTLIKKDRERIGGVTKARTERPKKLDEADQEKLLAAIAKNQKITCKDIYLLRCRIKSSYFSTKSRFF